MKIRNCDTKPIQRGPFKSVPRVTKADALRIPMYHRMDISGKMFTLYSIGWLALLTDRDPHTIRRYEYDQLIPPPLLKMSNRKRLYFAEEIVGYANAIKNANIRPRHTIASTGLQNACYLVRDKLKLKIKQDVKLMSAKLTDEVALYSKTLRLRSHVRATRLQAKNVIP